MYILLYESVRIYCWKDHCRKFRLKIIRSKYILVKNTRELIDNKIVKGAVFKRTVTEILRNFQIIHLYYKAVKKDA